MTDMTMEITGDAEGIDNRDLELLTAVYTAPRACLERGQTCSENFDCCSGICNTNGPIGTCG